MWRHLCSFFLSLLHTLYTRHLDQSPNTTLLRLLLSLNSSVVLHCLQDKAPTPSTSPFTQEFIHDQEPTSVLFSFISTFGTLYNCICSEVFKLALHDLISEYLKVSFFSKHITFLSFDLPSLRLTSNTTSSINSHQRLKQQMHGDQRHQTSQGPKKPKILNKMYCFPSGKLKLEN